jgi:Helix-turn-helix domain
MAELCRVKPFRRGAEYAPDSLCFTKIDRNQRIRVMAAADALEVRTKGKGCKSGVLKQSGLRVLRCLLFDFCAVPSGRCCPSYKAIKERTGYCEATISTALKRLEASGLLRIVRRIIRTSLGARQTSNAYSFSELGRGERKPDFTHSRGTTNLLKYKGMQPSLPGLAPVPLDFRLRNSLWRLGKAMGVPDAELQQKLSS